MISKIRSPTATPVFPESTKGVIVRRVDPDSAAAQAGLEQGDVILEVFPISRMTALAFSGPRRPLISRWPAYFFLGFFFSFFGLSPRPMPLVCHQFMLECP
jgi:hypothetical protein